MVGKGRLVVANLILRSASGQSVLTARRALTHRNVREFLPTRETLEAAHNRLTHLGFHVDLVAATHMTISGPADLFHKVFGVQLVQRYSPFIEAPEERKKHPHFVSVTHPVIPSSLSTVVEAVTFPGPIKYHAASTPPKLPYYHLNVPDDIARCMDAARAHAHGCTGTGVRLAIVDTGFMTPWHPYYVGRGYSIRPVVSDPNDPHPGDDSLGHGTAVAACALAVAPGATLTMYKAHLENNAAAFARAVAHHPHIISCSWEAPQYDPVLHLAVNHAVAEGIVVFFACGNEGNVAWPGCERAVLSVGGVYIDLQGHLEASNYASSGIHPDVPGRQVPDFCGIDGLAPHGRLIVLPTQPGCEADVKGSVNGRDGTEPDDGWVVESGTSGATPMVAAVAALVMQVDPPALGNSDAIRACLASSCVDVAKGRSASGQEAGPGVDPATGAGLVQAYAAIGIAEEHQRRRHSSEGRNGTMAAKGGEVRAWLFMRVDDPHAAAKELHSLVLQQQWNHDWSIKRVDTIDHERSAKLGKFPAPPHGFNLLVAVKAATENELHAAFRKIEDVVKPSSVQVPHAHVLTSSTYLDWQ